MTTREVRAFGNPTIHRTEATATTGYILTTCGVNMAQSADPRVWDGASPSAIIECPTCFAPAVHGSTPFWPIHPCTVHHATVSWPHYHVTNTGAEDGSGGTGHNSTVFESTTRHTVQGKRFLHGAPDLSQPCDTEPRRLQIGDLVEFIEDYGSSHSGDRATITEDASASHDEREGGLWRMTRSGDGASITCYGRRLRLVDRPPAEPTVYPCLAGHHTSSTHRHSRPIGSTHEWNETSPLHISTSGTATSIGHPPNGFERYCGPDGEPYLFSSNGNHTTTSQPCDTTPERESTMPDTTHETRDNAAHVIHKTTSPRPNGGSGVRTLCGTTLEWTVSNPRVWRGDRTPVLTECPTCFAPTVVTANLHTTAAGFQPGDIVRCTNRHLRPARADDDHLYLVLGDGPERGESRILTMVNTNNTGTTAMGWLFDDRRTPENLRPIVNGGSGWYFYGTDLVKVPDAEADLSPEMEAKRREVQIAALGFEPVLPCTNGEHQHSAQPHRHAHGNESYSRGRAYYARRPVVRSDYTPEPGLWTNNPDLVTVSQGCDTSTETVAEAVDLRPITHTKAQGVTSVILTSREGALTGDSVVFGCQTIPLNVIQRAGGTLAFQPSGGVIVTSKGTVNHVEQTINIGDRSLMYRDINEYTTSIVVDSSTPPDPDADVMAAIYSVIRGSVESVRRTRSETILADLRAAGWDVVKRDA